MTARPSQLNLNIRTETEAAWMSCRGIFSLSYLRQHLANSAHFPSVQEAEPIYAKLKTRWQDNLPGLRRRKEAYTRTQFLDPTLREMGWYFIPEADLPVKTVTRKRPDYCLFEDEQAQQRAAKQDHALDVFRESAAVLEAKKVLHSLDKVSEVETPGWFPSQQIQDYLRHAKDATGHRFFNWAILSNGNEWRLYCEQAPVDAYFAFYLADDQHFCPLEDFRYFLALFRAVALTRTDGRCLLDDLRENALNLQTKLEENLRKRIFDVLEDLATAYWQNPENTITESDFKSVYDASLIFLYRLLFVLYAESRDLLPAKPTGPGANKRYREQFSLVRLISKLRDRTTYPSDEFEEIYEVLLKLFRLINGDRPKQNEECRVTRYNGGLFKSHPQIEKWRIGDKSLADVLRQLIFAQPPARASARQQQISTDDTIDYFTLEVRQLGDIYEGLLGAELKEESGRLVLMNENGENHRHGIYYTPDWVVRYLIRESMQPLLDEIEQSPAVQAAGKAKSEEKQRDNSFAFAVLRLNLVDPAMGSGHFLVRATEWLAEQILYHPTTKLMTEQIVSQGEGKRTREQIVKAGKIPVPPGVSQEQAETAYWRRRVVEACIYGVDINPLAVELAKLSLWLTCIAADEPLNFLDHHLREGNSLLSAVPEELGHSPYATEEDRKQATVILRDELPKALAAVIAENANIEVTASTEMEVVKAKEDQWKQARAQLQPFLNVANAWLAALDGVPLNDLDYRALALGEITPAAITPDQKKMLKEARRNFADLIAAKQKTLTPFHWHLEFPDVFFQPDGKPRPDGERGFDCYLGNPPYISTHTSAEQSWRNLLGKRDGYLEDLYVHFTGLGFQLLRTGGAFGFIVSDTFFTLNSKLRMREMLQGNTLTHLGQCDPFDATVDAAIFVAHKGAPTEKHRLLFVQARPRKDDKGETTQPEKELPDSPSPAKVVWDSAPTVQHGSFKSLRLHNPPLDLYRQAHKHVFFEPRPATLTLFERFNEPIKELYEEWWEKIETSDKFAENIAEIRRYHATLKPGAVTLIGLIAEGGQGMRTANNARFLGYLDGTPQAKEIKARREVWTKSWLSDAKINPIFGELLEQNGGNPSKPTTDSAAWEASIESLKAKFSLGQLGFTKSDLYRIVPPELVATEKDFQFAWEQRKPELLRRWQTEPRLQRFWTESRLKLDAQDVEKFRKADEISDQEFCALCQLLRQWVEQQRKTKHKVSRAALGLRSAENYTNPDDAPRIATIYNGLTGHGQFVPFRKGDPEGNRWADNDPLFIEWSNTSATWFFENSGRPESGMPVVRNAHLYFTSGITWSLHANHVRVKARFQHPCVFDASGSRLTPFTGLTVPTFLAIVNSDVFSFFLKKFVKHNQDVEINDMRQMPIVIPTKALDKRLTQLAERAIAAKRLSFTNKSPSNELVAALRETSKELQTGAPDYLRPAAQQVLLSTPDDCLAILERAINWEAEKLYGVEGDGPFDEF